MARLPCSIGPHFNPLRNRNAYLHIWGPATQEDRMLRLCPRHFPLVDQDLSQFKWDITEDTTSRPDAPTDCLACLQPVDETGLYVSVTSYPAQNQREDYSSRLHINCQRPEWMSYGSSQK